MAHAGRCEADGLRDTSGNPLPEPKTILGLEHVLVPGDGGTRNVLLSPIGSIIESIRSDSAASSQLETDASLPFSSRGLLALPSLCHPHLHLDKPHLLTHPSTSHLCPKTGSFAEALSLTASAKPLYSHGSVLERMQSLLADSSRAGVTHVRGFAEVDSTVNTIALDAALAAKRAWDGRLVVQVCAFAQDPVFSGEHGATTRKLMESAALREGVEVLGSTPYVESDRDKARDNVVWAVQTAMAAGLHLDLHLDYNVDEQADALVWWVLEVLRRERWTQRMPAKTVCLGHCTRLTLFTDQEWKRLRDEVEGLPIYFVGLPTSDLFMMGRPPQSDQSNTEQSKLLALQDRKRCTLQIPAMISAGFNACIGINNVGNAFTPYGSADPLILAQWCVGLYQTGTPAETEVIFDCISTYAKEAIGVQPMTQGQGLSSQTRATLKVGDNADIVLIGRPQGEEGYGYRRRTKICEVVWDAGSDRQTICRGKWVRLD